jgi:hypothetical protein
MLKAVKWAAAAMALVAAPLLVGAVLVDSAPVVGAAQAAGEKPVVVELFTSQGCNSCPPAEALLRELAEEEGIVALQLHVDYWDYIGWPDPFASPVNTERQRSYAGDLGLRYVYTPQMVIDGRHNVVGSDRRAVRKAIEEAAARSQTIAVELSEDDGGRIVIPAGHSPDGGAKVWLAVYDGYHATDVSEGENAGRRLESRNVVRELVELGTWRGERMEIPVDLAAAQARGRAGCVVLLQQGATGPILGSAAMPLGDL